MKEKEKHIFKSSMKMSVVTMVSRVFGLVRDQMQAVFLGTSYFSDAYNIAFLLPNLLRRLSAEGAMTVSFVPVFTEVEQLRGREQAQRLFSSFFTLLLLVLMAITIAGMTFSPFLVKLMMYTGEKTYDPKTAAEALTLMSNLTTIMFPYILLISLAALVQGILNIHHNFTVPAFTPVLLNISIISIVLFFNFVKPDVFPNITYAFATGVLVGGTLQFLYQLPSMYRTGYRIRISFNFRDRDLYRIGRLFTPGIFGVSVYQINVLVSYYFAASLGEGRVSALTFSSRVNELALGIFAVSLATVMLSTLSREALDDNKEKFVESINYSLRLLGLIMIPAMVGSFILSEDIVRLLFNYGKFNRSSVDMTSASFRFLSLELFFVAGYRVIAQSFYSLKDTRTPVMVSAAALVINAVLCYFLPRHLGLDIAGIAIANTSSNISMFVILYIILQKKLGKKLFHDWTLLLKTIFASAGMGVLAYAGHFFFLREAGRAGLIIGIFCLIAVCVALYAGLSIAVGNRDIRSLASLVAARLRCGSGRNS